MTESWDRTPDELRGFIAAEQARPDPPSDTENRVFQRVAGTLGLPLSPVPGTPARPDPTLPDARPGSAGLGRLSRLVSRRALATFLVGAAAGGATVGTVDRLRPSPSSQPAPRVAPSPTPAPMLAPPPPPAVASPSPPPAHALSRPPAQPARGEGRDKSLEAERKLVEMARTALSRGKADAALAALRRHQRSFPRGELAEERDSLLVSVLVALHEVEQARASAARFHREYPHSLFGPSVDQSLQPIP